jgi:serine/threonine protein kinase/Tol biopolymer transport system component
MGSPEHNELEPGRNLGHYRIIRRIGAGGMGEVYLAEDARLERRVAVKILPAELAQNPDRMGRFIREAKAASTLNHPHIAHIYEIGESDGVNFIAMEYVDGDTLRDKIHRDKEPLRTLLKYLQQVAEGLAKAHDAGVVHRDLKPDNVIVSRDGYAKVLDFGLAKHVEPDGPGPGDSQSDAKTVQMHAALSTPGTIMGTAGYMSPEQARGAAKLDQRSDIFAFGCLLYEAATAGRQAFPGETAVDSMYKILHSQPEPITEFNPAAPPDLQRVIRRCLRKDPEDRYQNIKDVAIEIREILDAMKGSANALQHAPSSGKHAPARATIADHGKWTGEGAITVPSDPAFAGAKGTNEHEPVPAKRSKALKAVAGGILLAGIGGLSLGVYQLTRTGGPTPGSNLRVTPLTSSLTVERSPALSTDGKQFAYVWAGEKSENFDVYVKITDAGSPVRVTSNPAKDMSPSFSPDGRFIAFLRGDGPDKGFYVVPALGGAERKVADSFGWSGAGVRAEAIDWSPDGKTLAVIDKEADAEAWSLYLVTVDSGQRRKLTMPPPDHDGDMQVAYSPDGSSIAIQRRRDASTSDIYVLPSAGGEPYRVTTDGVAIRGFDWTADGAHIVFSSERGGGTSTLWSIAAEGGEPHPVAGTGENVAEVSVAAGGARLAYAQISTDINLWRAGLPFGAPVRGAERDTPAKFNASNRSEIDPHYSPAGDKVVFSSNRSGGSEIWVCDTEGGNAVQITNFGSSAVTGSPRWSPDGRQIAFDSRVSGNADIYVISAGGGTPRRLTEDSSEEMVPAWSADGRFVYYASRRSGRLELWKSPAGGGDSVQVTSNGGFVAAESRDGRTLYFTKGGSDVGLWSRNVGGGDEKKIINAPVGRNWAVGEKGIYYVLSPSVDGEPYLLFFYDAATGSASRPVPLHGSVRTLPINVVTVSPDERWILWAQRDLLDYDVMLVENFR